MLFEVGSLKSIHAFVHAFLFFGGFELGSLDRLLSSFLGFQSSFGCIFAYFYILLPSKGDRRVSWNAGSPKTKCLLQTRLLSSTLLFTVASPPLTAEIRSYLLLAVSSSGSSPWFVIILAIRKCFPLLLEQPTTTHKTILTLSTFPHELFERVFR